MFINEEFTSIIEFKCCQSLKKVQSCILGEHREFKFDEDSEYTNFFMHLPLVSSGTKFILHMSLVRPYVPHMVFDQLHKFS